MGQWHLMGAAISVQGFKDVIVRDVDITFGPVPLGMCLN